MSGKGPPFAKTFIAFGHCKAFAQYLSCRYVAHHKEFANSWV